MQKSKHMTGEYIKYWFACYISIDVQMMYTLSHTNAGDSVNRHVTRIHSLKL